jgi:hypothetical protein
MSCEFVPTPTAPLASQASTSEFPRATYSLTPEQVMTEEWMAAFEAQEAEELAAEREAVALVLAAMSVAAVLGFAAGYLFTRWGLV